MSMIEIEALQKREEIEAHYREMEKKRRIEQGLELSEPSSELKPKIRTLFKALVIGKKENK